MTLEEIRVAAGVVQKLGADIDDSAKLREASLTEVLFWGLNTGNLHLAGVPGSMVWGIRCDLDILIGFVEQQHEMASREMIAEALFRLRRRLDVAHELIAILARPAWAAANEPRMRNGGAVIHELPVDPRR